MAGLNKVQIIGNLGQTPDLRTMPNGEAVCVLSVATSEKWVDKKTGDKIERTEWHRVVLYRRLAEIAGQYLRKGYKIYIEGKLQTRKWQDKDGIERYLTEIIANEMQMLGGMQEQNQKATHPATPSVTGKGEILTPNEQQDLNDDIPF